MGVRQQYPDSARVGTASLSAANTNRDGSGTLVDLFVAGSNGSIVNSVSFSATATTTAGIVRVWHNDGSTSRLLKELAVEAVTPSGTVLVWSGEIDLRDGQGDPMPLPGGDKLQVTTHNAETFDVFARGWDF